MGVPAGEMSLMKYAIHDDGEVCGIGGTPRWTCVKYKLEVFPYLDMMPSMKEIPVDRPPELIREMATNRCSDELYAEFKRFGRDVLWAWDEDNVMVPVH